MPVGEAEQQLTPDPDLLVHLRRHYYDHIAPMINVWFSTLHITIQQKAVALKFPLVPSHHSTQPTPVYVYRVQIPHQYDC